MNILYAEDDQLMQKVVVKTLVRFGYEVTTVDDGEEAVETVSQESFDLIILDLFMPRLSGFEVLEIIREKLNCSTPVLILSRSHIDSDMNRVFSAGANDYLQKPFEPEQLIVKVTRMLAYKRQANE